MARTPGAKRDEANAGMKEKQSHGRECVKCWTPTGPHFLEQLTEVISMAKKPESGSL